MNCCGATRRYNRAVTDREVMELIKLECVKWRQCGEYLDRVISINGLKRDQQTTTTRSMPARNAFKNIVQARRRPFQNSLLLNLYVLRIAVEFFKKSYDGFLDKDQKAHVFQNSFSMNMR